jgi:hypothetical protein
MFDTGFDLAMLDPELTQGLEVASPCANGAPLRDADQPAWQVCQTLGNSACLLEAAKR